MMDSFKAVQRHLVRQQRWVKLCSVAVVLVTLVCLLLGSLGTDSAHLRSTGMGAFTEKDIGKYNLGHHVRTEVLPPFVVAAHVVLLPGRGLDLNICHQHIIDCLLHVGHLQVLTQERPCPVAC